jgi:hypothetical protein
MPLRPGCHVGANSMSSQAILGSTQRILNHRGEIDGFWPAARRDGALKLGKKKLHLDWFSCSLDGVGKIYEKKQIAAVDSIAIATKMMGSEALTVRRGRHRIDL